MVRTGRPDRGGAEMTPQQQADELLADYQSERNIDRVTEAIVQADNEVRLYQQSIIALESAVWRIKKQFTDPRIAQVWHDEIEVCRDVLSKLLDTAEGKLK